jgi:NADPH-dependent 2,4-dienoyl-CoA reductase/sulfur reductase-like enzyme
VTGRRTFLKYAAGVGLAPALAPAVVSAQNAAEVVVVGGGFAGATCARWLKKLAPPLSVTLVEPNPTYTACPFSNDVLAGRRELGQQQFGYDGLKRAGVVVAQSAATAIDVSARSVTIGGDTRLAFDRLVIAPGVDMNWTALPGYSEAAAEKMPHAWKAGPQTALLRRQLEAMEDGGLVVIAAPAVPYRCPPGPYERAGLIAWYLKNKKPRSKVLILDAKDAFSKQRLFQNAWAQLYPGLVEWVPLSQGGNVASVDPATMTVSTDFEKYKAAVANVIPPQRAGAIAAQSGVADRTGWCPIEPVAFESTLQPGIHVLGDAAIMGAMPKSAFAANAQAKVCAAAIVARLAGRAPQEPRLINTCYSLAAPDYGFSIAGVYHPDKGQLLEVPGSGGISPIEADASFRQQEARYAESWFATITGEVFG